jgi:hypothetical protein
MRIAYTCRLRDCNTTVLVKNAVRVYFYDLVPISAYISRVLAIPNLYLTHFNKKPPLLYFSIGRQNKLTSAVLITKLFGFFFYTMFFHFLS